MKLFVCSDLHSYFTPFKKALDEKGFEPDNKDHLLIVCGDVFDRGEESFEMLKYLRSLTNVVLIKGNHEDLLEEVWYRGFYLGHDYSNGTVKTITDIFAKHSDLEPYEPIEVSEKVLKPFFDKMINYFETKNYIFVHGWIPCEEQAGNRKYIYRSNWRDSTEVEWASARWLNGIDCGYGDGLIEPGKTIVCGHWHCSYGHALRAFRESNGEYCGKAFGSEAKWEPFEEDGIIAIDRCTAHTGEVNVIVLEDELLEAV